MHTFSINLGSYRSIHMHIQYQQRIVLSLLISTHKILNTNESTTLKFNYSDLFVLSTTLIYKLNTTLTSNSYHSKYVWFICLLIRIHNLRKILINDSSDSNLSSKFMVLAVVAFTIEEKRKTQGQQAKETHNILEYCNVRTRIILLLWFL